MIKKTDSSSGHPPKRDRDIKPINKTAVRKRTQKYDAWTFPKNTLEEAISLAQVIEEKNAGKPIKAEALAQIVGFKVNDWRFLNMLVSANRYGILEGSGMTATVSLTSIGADI